MNKKTILWILSGAAIVAAIVYIVYRMRNAGTADAPAPAAGGGSGSASVINPAPSTTASTSPAVTTAPNGTTPLPMPPSPPTPIINIAPPASTGSLSGGSNAFGGGMSASMMKSNGESAIVINNAQVPDSDLFKPKGITIY